MAGNQGMKFLSAQAYDYMEEKWNFYAADELTALWNSNEPECVAKLLVEAGVVLPNSPEAKELIAVAKGLSELTFRRKFNKALKKHSVVKCDACSHLHYIPPYCDVNGWIAGPCDKCAQKGLTKVIQKPKITEKKSTVGK